MMVHFDHHIHTIILNILANIENLFLMSLGHVEAKSWLVRKILPFPLFWHFSLKKTDKKLAKCHQILTLVNFYIYPVYVSVPNPESHFLEFFRFCILINISTLFFRISHFFRPKVTNLQNGDVFCIFKKISFFIYEFLRGWFLWNFDFCIFYTNLLLPVHVVRHQFGNYPQIWSLKVKLPSLVTWLENVVLY